MIIGVSLSTITSVNAYNYNKNAFENTDELKIIYNQIAKKEKSINACSLDGQAVYTWGYPTTKGRILVTGDAYKNLIPTGHAAIVYSQNRVVEALSNGVVTGKNDWNKSKNTCWGLYVTEDQAKNVADWCYSQRGKPYNIKYYDVNTRSKFYCSRLIWAGFKDKYNVDLNTSQYGAAVHPIEFVSSDKTMILYKK